MPKAVLIVHTEPPSPEREAEYHEWYDTIHIPDVLALDGFKAATRYTLGDAQLGHPSADTPRYLAIYELESDDLQATLDGLGAGIAAGTVRMQDAPLGGRPGVTLYVERSPRVEG